MKVSVRREALIVDLGARHRSLSSAVLGGGLGWVRTWLNLRVPSDYRRTDPDRHLGDEARDLPGPVVGMLTAAPVTDVASSAFAGVRAFATVGLGHPLAAAGSRPRAAPPGGTINLLVVVDEPLTEAGLVGAVQTAVEAKAQALADAWVRADNHPGLATGTATDALCVACPPGGRVAFAGPATRVGGAIAWSVHRAVLEGIRRDRMRRAARPGSAPEAHGEVYRG
jgi:adenosylcobinamide amidohydrolase